MAIALLLTGCVTRYEVKVDATARRDFERDGNHSYRIRHVGLSAELDSLRVGEAAQHVKTALSGYGWFEAVDPSRAEMIVEIDVAIGPPRPTALQYEDPVFGHPFPAPGSVPCPEGEPDEIVAYEKATLTFVVREKVLSIAGYDNTPPVNATPRREIWRVQASVSDESRDVRRYLPLLAAAAMSQVGRNCEDGKTVSLGLDSESVRFVRNGM